MLTNTGNLGCIGKKQKVCLTTGTDNRPPMAPQRIVAMAFNVQRAIL